MDAITNILNNPVLRAGLGSNMTIGLEVASIICSKINNQQLMSVIDKELAYWSKEYATTSSVVYKRELEIRIHTILGILNEWEKVT